jgi:hypothetical protein
MLEDFARVKLPAEEIDVPAKHQPSNPDDEDDIVPDQHAAFGIQRATQKAREPAWRDLGLDRLMTDGPPKRRAEASTMAGAAASSSSTSPAAAAGGQVSVQDIRVGNATRTTLR